MYINIHTYIHICVYIYKTFLSSTGNPLSRVLVTLSTHYNLPFSDKLLSGHTPIVVYSQRRVTGLWLKKTELNAVNTDKM